MRNAIKEYIPLTDTEKKELWDNATFVFDTNVFLNLYRYSKRTCEVLLGAMTALKEHIWMPYQVADEFMKRRPEIIYESSERYLRLADDMLHPCKDKLRIKSDDPDFKELQEYVQKWIETYKSTNLLVESPANDLVLDMLLDLFDGKVGSAYSSDELETIKKEGTERYKKSIPPGYKDGKKATSENDSNAYGDLIIWNQIIDYAKNNNRNIIFVTSDQKEDWWRIVHGKTIGPREELIKEFTEKAGMKFHMYTMDSFIARYQTTQDSAVDSSVVDEVKSYNDMPFVRTANVLITLEKGTILREALSHASLPEIISLIMAVEDKKARREAELLSIVRKYDGKKKPHSVQVIEQNLHKNIREDERTLNILEARRNALAHGLV